MKLLIKRLKSELARELAKASEYPEWFLKLSTKAQQEYIKNRPRSLPRKLWDQGIKPEKKDKAKKSNKIKPLKAKDAKTRESTNKKQEVQRRNVLNTLNKTLARLNKNTSGGVSLTGLRVVNEYKERGSSAILGQKVENSKDLAFISQIYKNPVMETLRFVYTKGGKVVGHNTISQRMPASVSFNSDSMDTIKQEMKNLEADSYYLLHNHPSGDATPSDPDIRFTQHFAENVRTSDLNVSYGGHVVINHNEYSVITEYGEIEHYESSELEQVYNEPVDVVENYALNIAINDHRDLAFVGALLYQEATSKDSITLVGTKGRASKVNLTVSFPKDLLTTNYSYEKIAPYMRAIVKQAGTGGYLFAVLPYAIDNNNAKELGRLVEDGIFIDIVDSRGNSINGFLPSYRKKRDLLSYRGKAHVK